MSVLEIPAERYHADDLTGAPCLNASIANLLLAASPAHARAAHPKLNPDYERKQDEKFDRGLVAHDLLLEGRDDRVFVIAAPDWRMKDTKLMRDDAREQGRIPLLTDQWREVKAMVDAVRPQLADHPADPPLFTDGKPEQTLLWEEDGVACKARLDWLRDDHVAIDDLKTTSRLANPTSWSRSLFGIGYDVQAAWYIRGHKAVFGVEPVWRWCVVETSPPYALSVISLAPDALAIADAKVAHALGIWRRCLAADEWPSYPAKVAYAEAPPWEEARLLEMRDEVAA